MNDALPDPDLPKLSIDPAPFVSGLRNHLRVMWLSLSRLLLVYALKLLFSSPLIFSYLALDLFPISALPLLILSVLPFALFLLPTLRSERFTIGGWCIRSLWHYPFIKFARAQRRPFS